MFQKSARFKVTRTEEKGREAYKNALKKLSGRNSQSCHKWQDQFKSGKSKQVVQKIAKNIGLVRLIREVLKKYTGLDKKQTVSWQRT